MKINRLKELPEHDAANHQLVLGALQSAKTPMTAYEILYALRRNGFHSPPTVYRALKRLMDSGDVHRLESINAYLRLVSRNVSYGKCLTGLVGNRGQLDHAIRIRLPDFLVSLIQAS